MVLASSQLRLLVSVLFSYHVGAARIKATSFAESLSVAPPELSKDGAPPARTYIRDQDMICGGPTIWSMLTAGSSIRSVQNIKWGNMEALAKAYVSEQTAKVTDLKIELESLATLIQEKELQNAPEYTTPGQNTELIVAALGEDSFGGLDTARDSDCGSPRGKTRAPRGAYKVSQQVLSSVATNLFKDKRFRLDGDGFLNVCNQLLPSQQELSYCERLCQSFKDEAQRISSEAVGEGSGSTDELIKQQQRKQQDMARAEAEVADCNNAWEGLSLLRTNIEMLKDAMGERFEDLQNAQEALNDAQWNLVRLKENLDTELEVAEQALRSIVEAGAEKQRAESALQKMVDEETRLTKRLESLKVLLQEGHSELQAAKNADKTVVDLMTAVSATMVKMDLFSTSGVVEPLKSIGFEATLDLDKSFPADPATISSAGILKTSVENMHEYCAATAKPAFDEVKGFVTDSAEQPLDLSPLCGFGEVDEITSDLNEAVVDRMESVKEQILWAKSWLNPYRANKKMGKERAAELVELGEPMGFQEIISVYHGTNFFQYLKNWRYKGPFLELIARLQAYMESMDSAVQKRDAELKEVKAGLEGILAVRIKAIDDLEQASELLASEKKEKAELANAASVLNSQSAALERELADLEAAVREAEAQYEKAKKKLLRAHAEGTFIPPSSKESLAQLRTQRQEARQLISLLERSLARKERSYQDAQTLLAKMQK